MSRGGRSHTQTVEPLRDSVCSEPPDFAVIVLLARGIEFENKADDISLFFNRAERPALIALNADTLIPVRCKPGHPFTLFCRGVPTTD
nr:MAG: hypothetical protein [Bacteriophage sp.]